MSGSPVYDADGRLIGAVAYGLSWGPSPVAGVTPYADMAHYLAATPAPAPSGSAGRRPGPSRGATDVTASQAAEGFSQLPMPLGVSGVSSRRLAQASKPALQRATPGCRPAPTGWAPPRPPGDGPGADTVVAGGNLAASLSYGDVTQAGVGTATRSATAAWSASATR